MTARFGTGLITMSRLESVDRYNEMIRGNVMIKYGQFCFKGRVIDLSHLAYNLRRSVHNPNLLLSHLIVDKVELLVEAGLTPYHRLKTLRILASTGFKLGGNAALQVLELADHIEQLSENS